jgi:hypothetical protein
MCAECPLWHDVPPTSIPTIQTEVAIRNIETDVLYVDRTHTKTRNVNWINVAQIRDKLLHFITSSVSI